MKHKYTTVLALFMLLSGTWMSLEAQQFPISLNQIFRTGLWNPANMGARDLNNVHLVHQQRKMAIPGWRSISQFLNFNSQPMGRHGNFGVGAMISNDIEHTENRFALSFAMAVQPIKTANQRLSLGASFGIINWASKYSDIKVFDRTDELLLAPLNFLDLDAGMGIEYEMTSKKVDVQLGAAGVQLPGNFMSRRLNGLRLNPHLMVGGTILLRPAHNIKVGPLFFYKDIFMRQDTVIQGGAVDAGLKIKLDRQELWAAGSYRFNMAALNIAFGAQVYVSDSSAHPTKSVILLDLNAGFSYPLQESTVFGPTIEIGVDLHFGKPFKKRMDKDSVRFGRVFWENDGNLNRHLEDHLVASSPTGLRGQTYVTTKKVTLTYRFPDPTLLYLGTPHFDSDSLTEVGMEWIGVDGFMEGVVEEVIKESLNPDTLNVMNPEDLEPLRGIEFIELSAFLKANEAEADVNAEGVIYEGELGTNNFDEDTLFLEVVYNGADTTVGVPRNHYITNLELACLKLYAMQRKMEYELKRKYGDEFAFVQEGQDYDQRELRGKKPVTIRKPRITPNNPNQDAFQVNQVRLRFSRGKVKSGSSARGRSKIDVDTRKKRRDRRIRNSGVRDNR